MIFTNPQPSDESLAWYYESYSRFGEFSPQFRISQLEFISQHTKKNCTTLFDIGAFNGDLLVLAREKGYTVSGIEPSEDACEQALTNHNIPITQGFFGQAFADSCSQTFDIVTARHVLEHIKNPVTFLRAAAQITTPGKYIYVEIPDTGSPRVDDIADFFSFHHIFHFTEATFRNLARVLCMPIVASEKIPEISAMRFLLRHERTHPSPLTNEYETNKAVLEAYIKQKKAFLKALQYRINPAIRSIIIYGAGGHTSQLLQSGLLKDIRIENIIDSNPKKQQTLFEGHTVASPDILQRATVPVLISTHPFQEEVSAFLSQTYPHVQQIKLYDRIASYDTGIFA
jgi:SAM-dependent methyltransferase